MEAAEELRGALEIGLVFKMKSLIFNKLTLCIVILISIVSISSFVFIGIDWYGNVVMLEESLDQSHWIISLKNTVIQSPGIIWLLLYIIAVASLIYLQLYKKYIPFIVFVLSMTISGIVYSEIEKHVIYVHDSESTLYIWAAYMFVIVFLPAYFIGIIVDKFNKKFLAKKNHHPL